MTNGSRKITDGLTADAPATPAPKAALYRRVTTGRQANSGSTPADRSLLRGERLGRRVGVRGAKKHRHR